MITETLRNQVFLASPCDTILTVIQRMATEKASCYGMAVIIDDSKCVKGVFNNGDALRLMASGADLSLPVEQVMVQNPVMVQESLSRDEMIQSVRTQMQQRGATKTYVKYLIVSDAAGQLRRVDDYVQLISNKQDQTRNVAVYGMGFVGLTLAAALADAGHRVVGVDVNERLIRSLHVGDVHVYEPRLSDMVRMSLHHQTLRFSERIETKDNEVYIIAVGTPLGASGKADLSALERVTTTIATLIKAGDYVMVRSTVPVGTTRNVILPLLEKLSGMRAGEDFVLSFTPERTIEGKTMSELRELPQIVSGATSRCRQLSSAFWSTLARSVIQVEAFEAGEMIKLINNSWRDLSFAYANAVSDLCDRYNLNAFHVIKAANEGYPRNAVSTPSPGVGGYCLTKDPYLFGTSFPDGWHAKLAHIGREVNESAAFHPVRICEEYAVRTDVTFSNMTIMVIGIAFKGWPATNDIRGSSALQFCREMRSRGAKLLAWDAVISSDVLEEQNLIPVDYETGCREADAIVILNNHPENVSEDFLLYCEDKAVLIYDGWNQLSVREAENIPNVTYATAGYLTNRSRI